MFSRLLAQLLLLSAIYSTVSCAKSDGSTGEQCYLPDPCDGPPGVLLVGFKQATTQAEIDVINASVNGKVVWPVEGGEQLYVPPAEECAAIKRLKQDTHVDVVEPEIYLYLTDPRRPDACPPAHATLDASSCRLTDSGDVLECEDGSIRIVR